MEKKSNLPNADELCVEYVLNELDPSEAVLVERAMESDMNLLIEIECLRRTLKKLEGLPRRNPPANIRDAIIHQAVTHYQNKKRSAFPKWNNTTVMATAAAVIFSALISIVNFYPEATIQPANIADQSDNIGDLTPWVDRNNVLHINQVNSLDPQMNITVGVSDLQHSLQRLRPIQNSVPLNPDAGDIFLTRTSN